MNVKELTRIDHLEAFLDGTRAVAFEVAGDKESRYRWVQQTLVKLRYLSLGRRDKGVVIRYLMRVSGYSRQQLTRLVRQYRDTGRLVPRQWFLAAFYR